MIFSLSVGLGPFVETEPASGAVGAAVNILGTNLTGATSVTFNGIAAKFTVVSSSEITTTVPAGATTGEVQVVDPQRHAFEQRVLPGAIGFALIVSVLWPESPRRHAFWLCSGVNRRKK
jgi:hypothetical protein